MLGGLLLLTSLVGGRFAALKLHRHRPQEGSNVMFSNFIRRASFQTFLVLGIVGLAASVAFPQAHQFVHPGISWSLTDLDQLAARRFVQPWSAGWNDLTNTAEASLNYQMRGPFELVSNRPNTNQSEHTDDANASLYHALQWHFTGNEAHAIIATEILDAWATTHTTWSGTSVHLHAAWRGGTMVQAAEILRHTYPGWTQQNTVNFEAYCETVLFPQFRMPNPLRAANQGANNLWGALQVAIFLSDQQKFADCVEAYLNDPCCGISNSLPNGQCGDTGRDQGHAGAMIGNLTSVAQILSVQGVDVYEVLDNRLLKMWEYWCKYNSGEEVDFIHHGTCYGYYTSIGPLGRGAAQPHWLGDMETIVDAYVVRKGIPAPYLTDYLAEISPDVDTFLYHRDDSFTKSTTASQEPLAALIQKDVNSLINTEIGNPSQNGSGSFSDGTWTLTGSGNGLNERNSISYHYAYTQLSGDGGMVARVQSLDNTDPNADAAIVIRASLDDPQASMASISARPEQGTQFSARVFDAADGNGTQVFPLSNLPDGPVWLKLERRGSRVFGFAGPDGVTWAPMQHVIFEDWPEDVYIGLAVTSHNNSELATATFSDVQIASVPIMDFDDFNGTQNLSGGGGGPTSAFFPNEGGGLGYNVTRQTNNNVNEANGLISLNSSGGGGARTAIESVASLDTTLADTTATFSFNGIEFENLVDPLNVLGPARTLVGVRTQEGSATTSPDLTSENIAELGEGIYFLFEDDDLDPAFFGTPGFQGNSTLFSLDSANVVTVLDSFSLDTLDFVKDANGVNTTPVLDIEFEFTPGGYTFTLTGDTAGGSSVTSSGSFAGLTNAAAYANNQSEGPDLALAIDSISITQRSGLPVVEPLPVLLGDCNQDGFVSFLDIAPLIGFLTSGVYLEQADCNEDGFVSFLDISPFIAILTDA